MQSLEGAGSAAAVVRAEEANVRLVSYDEFCSLVISRRNLVRCDSNVRDYRGLLDADTGTTYLIEEMDLFRHTGR